MITTLSETIESLVLQIKSNKLLLPEMQRNYVWKSVQVRDLFDSLYQEYPSGQLLLWETDDLPTDNRAMSVAGITETPYNPRILLDGQQRLTSIAAVMLDLPIRVQDAPKDKEIDIVFNVFTEKFEVAGKRYTIQNKWISLKKFFANYSSVFADLDLDLKTEEGQVALAHINKLSAIKKYPYHVNVLKHLSYETVTRIFVRTNSGGTKLGNADLALAQISSLNRGIVDKLSDYQKEFKEQSWGLKLDNGLLLRAIVVLLTGQSRFSRVFSADKQLTIAEIDIAWERVKVALAKTVSFLVHNCLIDHLEMLPTRNIVIPLVAFFDLHGEHMTPTQAHELQRWVYMALIWTRYSTSSETSMDQDIAALKKEKPVQSMIQNIENEIGHRPITEQNLEDQRQNSAYMVMAYVLARQAKAQDWFNNMTIANSLKQEGYHLHHIFPKSKLSAKYDLRKESRIVDQIANLVFLAAPVDKSIANRLPEAYLPDIDKHHLQAQHIPEETKLWKLDQFENFTRQRRIMLANAINQLLLSLSEDKHIWVPAAADVLETQVGALEKQLRALIAGRLHEMGGNDAWERLVPKEIRNSVQSHIKKFESKNPFMAGEHVSLESKLNFCLFSDLSRIISQNWPQFADIFGNQDTFTPYNRYVVDARNAFAHHNPVSDHALASAQAGLLWFEKCLGQAQIENEDEEDALSTAI